MFSVWKHDSIVERLTWIFWNWPAFLFPCKLLHPAFCQDPGEAWRFAELDGLVSYLKEAARVGQFKPDPLIPFSTTPSIEVVNAVKAQLSSE